MTRFLHHSELQKTLRQALSIGLVISSIAGIGLLTGCTQKTDIKASQLASAPQLKPVANAIDFSYPARQPSLKRGKEVFTNNCMTCHTPSFFKGAKVQKDLLFSTPIDLYVMLSTGHAPKLVKETDTRKELRLAGNHPSFKDKLSRDQRWDAIFYIRHLAGGSDINHAATNNDPDVAAIYGANCAVCHGKKGNANGPLHTGHPSSHELQGGKVHGGLFYPAPARFTQYDRMFNRTDAQLYKYIAEGVYPSGMPAWLGNVDQDKSYTFDETLLWMLVKHVRLLSYKSDLDVSEGKPSGLMMGKDATFAKPQIPAVTTGTFKYKGEHKRNFYQENAGSRMPLLEKNHSTHEELL